MAWLLLLLQATVGLAASVVLFWVFLTRSNWVAGEKGKKKGLREAPEPTGRLPVIGHLHLLRGDGHPAEKLGSMADKYGPAFTLRLGAHPTLVVSSCDLARECFTGANDRAFATRPPSAAGEHMGYNYAMFGFAPYGPYWREIRKMATLHVLSNARLDSLSRVRAAEVHAQAKILYRSWAAAAAGGGRPAEINVREWCADLTHNVMLQMVVGRRFSEGGGVEGRKFKKAIERFFRLLLPSVALDAIPLLGWLDWGGVKRDMKRTAAEMDSVLSVWLEEHKMGKKREGGKEEEADFMDVMLSKVKELQIEGYDEDTVVKATCLSLIIGGTDTTSVSLAWVLCFTLSHPDVLRRAREELATHVGDRRNVDESDLKNLVYLQAVVKETLRFAPAAALVVTHEAMEECAVGGFRVPAGTRLLVNLRKMQLDPAVWGGDGNDGDDDPSQFRPERFLTGRGAGVDVRGQHFECIPFGSGRRMCPGVSFALRVIHLVLARMVHGFEMKMEMSEEENWKKRLRLAADPTASDVKILLTPRLPSQLYE